MSLLGNGVRELQSMMGQPLTHYPHNGYDGGADDFWQDDQGWDKTAGTDFKGIVEQTLDDETLEEPGFDEQSESAVRTGYDQVSEGDMIEFDSREWIAISVTTHRTQGDKYQYLIGVSSHGN